LELLIKALEAAVALIMLYVLLELVRLRRAVESARGALPDIKEAKQAEEAIRLSTGRAQALSDELSLKAERLEAQPERAAPEPAADIEPEAQDSAQFIPSVSTRRGPRVLSEAGREKYDRVLHLAAQGLDAGSIASEVDLTRAEVELMLGVAG
jgi:hypothetical protein